MFSLSLTSFFYPTVQEIFELLGDFRIVLLKKEENSAVLKENLQEGVKFRDNCRGSLPWCEGSDKAGEIKMKI